ncbi:MAG: hypothetical protein ACRD3E_11015 [Terriglobales bacterium]
MNNVKLRQTQLDVAATLRLIEDKVRALRQDCNHLFDEFEAVYQQMAEDIPAHFREINDALIELSAAKARQAQELAETVADSPAEYANFSDVFRAATQELLKNPGVPVDMHALADKLVKKGMRTKASRRAGEEYSVGGQATKKRIYLRVLKSLSKSAHSRFLALTKKGQKNIHLGLLGWAIPPGYVKATKPPDRHKARFKTGSDTNE